jgi:outer membrane immunogenic protein
MKKLLLATSCLALSSVAVMAADLPPMAPTKAIAMPAPVFSWTGCYVGVHGGGGSVTNSEGSSSNGKGAVAGGQAGCNYQDGNWVFGAEGEGYWSGIRANQGDSSGPFEAFSSSQSNRNDFTIAARAGIALDRTLIYGKGGWAWGSFRTSSSDLCCSAGAVVSTTSQSGTLDGFLVGVGIEHALTRNWTIKLEYDYIAFGARELPFTGCTAGVCAVGGTSTISATKQLFKVGANYLFDIGGGPVVAKY